MAQIVKKPNGPNIPKLIYLYHMEHMWIEELQNSELCKQFLL